MSGRRRAREIVLQVLFQDDLNEPAPDDVLLQFVKGRLHRKQALVDFAYKLIDGVRKNREAIDQQIENSAENWKLARMAATDRNILRLGVFEIVFSVTPAPVAINEAIELAKRFGTGNSAQFVNGVLDQMKRQHESNFRHDPSV